MSALIDVFSRYHGVLRRQDFQTEGISEAEVRRLKRSGFLLNIRQGWYKCSQVPVDPIIEASVKHRCAYSGSPALALHGAWNLNEERAYLRAARQEHRHDIGKVIVLPQANDRYVPVSAAVDPIPQAFEVALTRLPEPQFIVVADSLANRKLLSVNDMQEIAARYPKDIQARTARVNHLADSGSESQMRLWLESQNLSFVQQYEWAERRYSDFLVGRRLIIEIDSLQHHGSIEAQQNDYFRDQYLIAQGYLVFRLTYTDIVRNWSVVSRRLKAIIARGDHLIPPHWGY
ncbi:type IV toxin-antitoxin system AbiEi family antitoxin domain-containing protein [Gulosibacter chungangensis]|uniref:DUF559 domain-containing protein n=1 Tax=Gulosibacter chungangensis TaxID=979746 RepID=A0A7J5BE18_9MICO|nr:type IV toxin-antitoxin system AbiEi family antitoxin domain-containing protein [Gulosibacter chungangensis]KAB1643528.1 DUF559 domain-containing protein [Gulosibacter chungangensis]